MALSDLLLSDLTTMLSTDDFSVAAVYSGTGLTINVIFDREYSPLSVAGIQVESTEPALMCKTSDVTGIDHTMTFTISGTVWKVREVKPDGTGMTVVMLKA